MCTKISVDSNSRTSYFLQENEEQRNLLLLIIHDPFSVALISREKVSLMDSDTEDDDVKK